MLFPVIWLHLVRAFLVLWFVDIFLIGRWGCVYETLFSPRLRCAAFSGNTFRLDYGGFFLFYVS